MSDVLWVVGDVQGYPDRLRRVLADVSLVDPGDGGGWTGGTATLAVVGDLVDRGPDGVGVIEYLVRLQVEAARQGGRVVVLLGNHDVLLLAAHKFDRFIPDWKRNGGVDSDLSRLTERHVEWIADLPAMWLHGDELLTHADAMFYFELGSTVREVNGAFRSILHGEDVSDWDHILNAFSEHRAFLGPEGCTRLDRMLRAFGGRRLVHGHTPVPRVLDRPAETVTAPYVYCDGRCVNVDPGFYLGGPGFAYSSRMNESSEDEGEILKASSPGREEVQVGMDVTSIDGQRIGRVKEIGDDEFLVDRPLARDLWVPFASILATEDYSGNFRGAVQPTAVVLEVSAAHVEQQRWRRA